MDVDDHGGAPFDLDLLLSVCSGLGRTEMSEDGKRHVYIRDIDCAACLKDLQRFLRRDDPDTRDAFYTLGEIGVAKRDLLPLLVAYADDADLVYLTLKVLTFLTMPVDPHSNQALLQTQMLRDVKEAFLSADALGSVMSLTTAPLGRFPRVTDEDHAKLQLVLTFIRNLLAIPDEPAVLARAGLRSRMQAELLQRLMDESALDLLLVVAGHADHRNFRTDAALLVDILCQVFAPLDPARLLDAPRLAAEQEARQRARREQAAAAASGSKRAAAPMRLSEKTQPAMQRHHRYRPTLVQRHNDSSRLTFLHSNTQAEHTVELKPVLQTQVVEAAPPMLDLRLLCRLHEVLQQVLAGPYNVLMGTVRKELEPGIGISRLEQADFLKFLRVCSCVTAYVRLQQDRAFRASGGKRVAVDGSSPFGAISATMGWETFHLVHTLWLSELDIPAKSQYKDWALQHACSSVLCEMLGVLELAERGGNETDRRAADRLQRRLLHDDLKESGLLPTLSRLMKNFSAKHESRNQAAVLVQCTHLVLRMYDRLCKQDSSGFLVRERKRQGGGGGRRRKADKPAATGKVVADGDAEACDERPQPDQDARLQQPPLAGDQSKQLDGTDQPTSQGGVAAPAAAALPPALAATISGHAAGADAPALTSPVAGGSPVSPPAAGAQSPKAPPLPEGVGETGSVEPQLGSPRLAASGAGGALDAAAAGGSRRPSPQPGAASRPGSPSAPAASVVVEEFGGGGVERVPPMEQLEEEMEEEQEERAPATREVALDLKRRVRQELAVPAVLHLYAWLLQGYAAANGPSLNKALVSFLWRVVLPQHLDLEPMLYQLSVLRVFHKILNDPSIRPKPEFKDMLQLATKVVRGLFAKLVPLPPPSSATGAAHVAQQGLHDQEHRAAGDEGGAVSDAAAAAAAAAERQEHASRLVSGMLFVDLLFWKSAAVAEQIKDKYHLEAQNSLLAAPQAAKGRKPGRNPAPTEIAAAAKLGGDSDDSWGDRGTNAPARPTGATGKHARGRPPPLLSAAGEAKLQELFVGLCANKSNLEELAAQVGAGLQLRQVARELKRLGLRFGALPESLAPRLRSLYFEHEGHADMAHVIARELPGGWSEKQVRKLLRDQGLQRGGSRAATKRRQQPKAGRRGARLDDSSDEGGGGGGATDARVLTGLDRSELEALYQQHLTKDDYLQLMAEELFEHDATPASVLATLQHHGIVAGGGAQRGGGDGGRRRRGRRNGLSKTEVAHLRELWEEHGEAEDALNLVAMQMPGGLSVQQVHKLLIKHGLTGAAPTKAAGAPPVDRDTLAALYEQLKGAPDWLDAMCEALPVPATHKQLKAWLRKLQIVAARPRQRRDPAEGASAVEVGGSGADAGKGGGAEARQRSHAVPQPQPWHVLGYLAAMQKEHDAHPRWMSASAAVGWLRHKLDAAESAWDLVAGGGAAPRVDFALVPSSDVDMDFFCTDWSNELLVGAGMRNDDGDYFKIPGNSTQAWRDSVRACLDEALAKLGSEEAAACLEALQAEQPPAEQPSQPSAGGAPAGRPHGAGGPCDSAVRAASSEEFGAAAGSKYKRRKANSSVGATAAASTDDAQHHQQHHQPQPLPRPSRQPGGRVAVGMASRDWGTSGSSSDSGSSEGGSGSGSDSDSGGSDMPRYSSSEPGSDAGADSDAGRPSLRTSMAAATAIRRRGSPPSSGGSDEKHSSRDAHRSAGAAEAGDQQQQAPRARRRVAQMLDSSDDSDGAGAAGSTRAAPAAPVPAQGQQATPAAWDAGERTLGSGGKRRRLGKAVAAAPVVEPDLAMDADIEDF